MDCLKCRGACCETFSIPSSDVFMNPEDDASRWLRLHGTQARGMLTFECRCTKLTAEGKCGIYETRPELCRTYKPGCADCLEQVRLRRTPEQYQEIRGPGDPERVHV